MPATHGGKGSDQRKMQVSREEYDLRSELWQAYPARKKVILERLEEIKKQKQSNTQ